MKKSLLTLAVSMCALSMTAAETPQTFTIDGKDYSYDLITSKQVGPGVVYNRIRIADFPLNINYMTVDLTNPYNRIETQQANEKTGTTEKLADAYTRMQKANRRSERQLLVCLRSRHLLSVRPRHIVQRMYAQRSDCQRDQLPQ